MTDGDRLVNLDDLKAVYDDVAADLGELSGEISDIVDITGVILQYSVHSTGVSVPSASAGDTAVLVSDSLEANHRYIAFIDTSKVGGNAIFIGPRTTGTGRVSISSGVADITTIDTGALYFTTSTGTTYTNGDVYLFDVNSNAALATYLLTLDYSTMISLLGHPVLGQIPTKTSQLINDSGFITFGTKDEVVYSRFGVNGLSATSASLASGTNVEIDDFPHYLNKDLSIAFYAKFDSFTKVTLGIGYQTYRGRWVEIDDTNVTVKYCTEDGTEDISGAAVAHGLTISTYLSVVCTVDDDGTEKYAINTLGGTYELTKTSSFYHNGVLFANGSQAMTDVTLRGIASGAKKSMWCFGDSYLGFTSIRVMGNLRTLGYTKGLCVDAFPGLAPTNAYNDLQRMLEFGKPKYLIWALGMNHDGTYESVMNNLITYCNANGIELILYMCPSVPTKDRAFVRTAVAGSGERYIDANLAVGASADGATWYTGYLSDDGVHPTESGAMALAMRYLVDVPEIMQFTDEFDTST